MTDSPPSPRGRWFQRHPRLAGILVALVVLLVLDVALGSLLYALDIVILPSESYYRVPHPIYHHSLRPNYRYERAEYGSYVHRIRINSLGFKDADIRDVALRDTTRHRVLLLGDSFTEGVGMTWEDSFAGMLQKDLGVERFEILNAGVNSYSPAIYLCKTYDLLARRGLEVDEVVVLIDMGDILDATLYLLDAEEMRVVRTGHMDWTRYFKRLVATRTLLLHGLRRGFHALKFAVLRQENTRIGWPSSLWGSDPKLWKAFGREGLRNATDCMDRLASFLRERAVPLTVVVYPWPDQIVLGDPESRQKTHWQAWCAANGSGFVDLFRTFIDLGPSGEVLDRYFFDGNFHWTREGHRVVADRLRAYLLERNR